MRVLITNDDGPPNERYSPYVANFVQALQKLTDWELVIAVPSEQRSWIGKAHIIGKDVEGTVIKNEHTGDLEWILLNGTPASCANIGVKHLGPFDLVISGPNYGRNTSAAYVMSSGTVGAAAEAAIAGVRSIALSFSYTRMNHPGEHVSEASRLSIAIMKYLVDNWNNAVQIYSVNIPLFDGSSSKTPIHYTKISENHWDAVFSRPDKNAHCYKWSPDYAKCDETVYAAGPGSDAWAVLHNEITVSPIKAVFQSVDVHDKIDSQRYL